MSQGQKSSSTHDQALPTVTHSRLQPRYILAMQLPTNSNLPPVSL